MKKKQLYRDKMKFKSFADLLQKRRLKQGFTKERLAELVGISEKTIYNYEQGLSQPSIETILNISKALQINLPDLCPELCLIDPQKILYERHKCEFESAIIFLNKASNKDLQKLERLLEIYNLCESLDETLDIDRIVHKTLLKYVQPSKKHKCNQLINSFFQHVNTFSEPLSENSEYQQIHYEIHHDLLKSVVNRNKSKVLLNYEKHLNIAENALLKFSAMYN